MSKDAYSHVNGKDHELLISTRTLLNNQSLLWQHRSWRCSAGR